MLVVDRVELSCLEHLALRRLHVKQRAWTHGASARREEVDGVTDVREHVLPDDRIEFSRRRQVTHVFLPPESDLRVMPLFLCKLHEVGSRVDTVRLPASRRELVELRAIVAGKLEHCSARALLASFLRDLVDDELEVLGQRPTSPALVVVVGEDALARDEVGQLRVVAAAALDQLERVALSCLCDGRVLGSVVGKRLLAQVKHSQDVV